MVTQSHSRRVPARWALPGGLTLSRPAQVMAIINCTPDSFSDGGHHLSPDEAVAAARRAVQAGARWLDIGGESSRPGAAPVSEAEELRRILPVVAACRSLGVVVSVDTCKAAVAARVFEAGAGAINDITGGRDPAMLDVVASCRVPLVIMHMQGSPQTMQRQPRYQDVVEEVLVFFQERMEAATRAGIREEAIILDPGIGFGKTFEHNLALLRALPRLGAATARPLLVGVSRKSFLTRCFGRELPPEERDGWSHLVHLVVAPHCALIRVHDVPSAQEALRALALYPEVEHG